VLVVIGDSPDEVAPSAHDFVQDTAAASPRGAQVGTQAPKPQATPLVRRIAHELGVDIDSVVGTGPNGRVTEDDVRAASGANAPAAHERREPLRGVRRLIAEHMALAHREIPPVTWVEECDFEAVDLKLLVPTVLKACALSLEEFPELNARLEGDEIVYLDRCDLGVAVQTDQGLVVPVVRSCESASLGEVAAEVTRLAESARAGTLKPEELRGGTFTVTSAGKLGGVFVTPLVNHPEVAILGLHRAVERPVVRDGQVVVRRVGNVSVSFDHRVVDGARAAAFCLDVIERLQSGRAPGA
jgi:pyruvate/2-oxoglutarate dehydrogenase complex dihydrolipoamide acyltransferase (E2) component